MTEHTHAARTKLISVPRYPKFFGFPGVVRWGKENRVLAGNRIGLIAEMKMNCRIQQGLLGRWYIFHPIADDFAWSGSDWSQMDCGLPIDGIQVCNFTTRQEAEEYVDTHPYLRKNCKS